MGAVRGSEARPGSRLRAYPSRHLSPICATSISAGKWFDEAKTVWADPHGQEAFDPDHSDDEDRYVRFGVSTLHRTLLVVFCERDGGHTIRIVSARKATPREREQYEERI